MGDVHNTKREHDSALSLIAVMMIMIATATLMQFPPVEG